MTCPSSHELNAKFNAPAHPLSLSKSLPSGHSVVFRPHQTMLSTLGGATEPLRQPFSTPLSVHIIKSIGNELEIGKFPNY